MAMAIPRRPRPRSPLFSARFLFLSNNSNNTHNQASVLGQQLAQVFHTQKERNAAPPTRFLHIAPSRRSERDTVFSARAGAHPVLDRLSHSRSLYTSLNMFSLGRKLPSAGSLLVGILVGLLVATVSEVTFFVGVLLTYASQLLRQGGDVRVLSVVPFPP
jgi:hypothetical protein